MTQVLPERSPRRSRWPWSHRTSRVSDISAAVLLSLVETAVFALKTFSDAMKGWAAQGQPDSIGGDSTLASIVWTEHLLYVLLALAGLAALSRAPWTTVSHLLAAFVVFALLTGAWQGYDRTHPAPAPTPSIQYTPCLSGSGKCR
ncbi:DUF6234 family protein [Streptomyces sp. NPDC050508]|uniref:DUF6234 family protein n=1 Tax=Streptomyces sp. NPDC050508 TaxID=3155405 RepID=UPI003421273F